MSSTPPAAHGATTSTTARSKAADSSAGLHSRARLAVEWNCSTFGRQRAIDAGGERAGDRSLARSYIQHGGWLVGDEPFKDVESLGLLRRPARWDLAMDDPYDLTRFVTAQDARGTYDHATAELRRGRKTSHWMWFVFPQIAGLGQSPTSRRFAICTLDEARAYLAHPVLGPRLIECAGIVAATQARTAEQIFGDLDALKLRSSVTLFLRADPGEPVFAQVLDRYFDGLPDPATDRLLREQGD